MINPDKIEEWIHEVEERPTSAPNILRYISGRLRDLTVRNEELLAENIELRSGRKIEEYENRISNLEYQLDLLRRQVGGAELPLPTADTASLLVYNALGQVLRVEVGRANLTAGQAAASFAGELAPDAILPRLLVTSTQEELLFVFDSGRTAAVPAADIPACDPNELDWSRAYLQEPHVGEELAVIAPVAKMTLYDFCVQSSRRGFVKKIREEFFEGHVAKSYIGTGVKAPADRTCGLALCSKDDQLALASKEGFIVSVEMEKLPFTIEEVLRLGPTDHIVSTFAVGKKPSILIVTQNGKAIHREASWLEPAVSFKSRGQAAFSKEKREAGVRIIGAAAVDENDWSIALRSDGQLISYPVSELLSAGSLLSGSDNIELLGFSAFVPPQPDAPGYSRAES